MRRFAVLCVSVLALAACGSSGDVPSEDPPTPASSSVAESAPATSSQDGSVTPSAFPSEVSESATVSAAGVLSAAVLLASGDVEQAVADGRVTPDEVDAAVEAIEGGFLDQWAQLADS